MRGLKKIGLLLLLAVCCVAGAWGQNNVREVQLLNREWKYAQGDYEGAQRVEYNDRSWENVGIPHSFSIPYFMSKDFYVGYGWYRKVLVMKEEDLHKRVFLEFDGVFQECEVFVNDQLVKRHIGGYTGFEADITQALHLGENVLAVRVNNIWHPDVAPRAGEHVFSGGIYRNVRLVKTHPVRVAWYGTFVTTPQLADTQGRSSSVQIVTEIENYTPIKGEYKLVTRILSPQGDEVASVTSQTVVPGKGRTEVVQRTASIQNPMLWSSDNPSQYRAISLLYHGKEMIDRYETSFGFRWMQWTSHKGFFFNGKHLYLRGANVHQDQAGWGDAVTDSAAARDVQMMQEAGFNFIRGSHYPHSPAFVDACDRSGMLFWSEAPFWGIGGFREDGYWNSSAYPVQAQHREKFDASAMQQLEEMIRIHRNHPSIIAWSMCNEAFFSAASAMDGVRELLRKMVKLTHRLDSTRAAAIGGAQRPLGEERIDHIGDVAAYNGDGATQPDFQNPGVPNMVSEYGSVTDDRPGKFAPGWGDLAKGEGWKGRDWRSGQAVWCGFDHGSIAGEALGKMGIVDYFRIPKRSWYWYRNTYRGIRPPQWPTDGVPKRLKLVASKVDDIKTDGTDDVQLLVTVCDEEGRELTASPDVTLRILSGPGQFPTGRQITFSSRSDIRIQDGKAAITLRSYYAGVCKVEAISDGLHPAQLTLNFTGSNIYKEGITPLPADRPYKRFIRQQEGENLLVLGLNNPIFASSSHEAHPMGMAADGKLQTWWQASGVDSKPYITLDMEKVLELKRISIAFPFDKTCHYIVDISEDGKKWVTVEDKQFITKTAKKVEMKTNGKARFIRLRFIDNSSEAPASLAEISAVGKVVE